MKNAAKAAGAGSSRCDKRCFMVRDDGAPDTWLWCHTRYRLARRNPGGPACHRAEHELMNLLPVGANELGFCPSCNGSLSMEGLRGWGGRGRTSVKVFKNLKQTSTATAGL